MTGPGALVAGRYRLRSQLGGGGMGAVWLARDELLGREVAVKQVLVPVGIDAALAQANREAAMREGRIAARLSHPHAVGVYDMVLDEGQPWLVMEYLPSVSLAGLLHERGVLPVEQVAQIGAQVADALTATHAAGVVHRDVKPGNILIGEGPGREGLVKITDFGISRAVGDVSLTQTGVVKGTPAFLAPEVAQGSSPDEASDVFSLGATLYACLEGSPPFGLSDNALQMLHRVAGGDFQPPRQAGVLTAPLMRMLHADPTRRPTMPQVRDELAKLAAGRDRDVTEVLTARTLLPKTLPGMPARRRSKPVERVPIAPPTPVPVAAPTPAPASASAPAAAAAPAEPTARQPRQAGPPGHTPAEAASAPPARSPDRTSTPARSAGSPAAGAGAPARSAAPQTAGAPPAAPERRRRTLWLAVLAGLLVASAVAVLLVFLTDPPGGQTDDAGRTAASSTPAPASTEESPEPEPTTPSAAETTEESTPETTAETSSAPPAQPVEDGPVTAAEMEQFVTDYYALLPENPDAAYERTGPRLRAAISARNYAGFWSRYQDVTLSDPQAVEGELVVNARVTYVEQDGDTLPEQHRIELVETEDGQLLIDRDVQP